MLATANIGGIMSRLLGYISLFLVLSLGMCMFYKRYDKRIYSKLMKFHQPIVVLILILSLIHGIMAGKVSGMISGKVSWFILLLSLVLISFVKKYSVKMKVHHVFAILFTILCLSHIIFLW